MKEWNIHSKALLKMIAHAAKYQDATIIGIIVGKDQTITNTYPLYHSPITLTLTIAIEQIKIFESDEIIGFYYAPVNNNAQDVPLSVQEFKSILSVNDPLMICLDFDKYDGVGLNFMNGIKTRCDAKSLIGINSMIGKRSYSLLVDFDEHLDNNALNWLANPKFTLANVI